MESGLRRRVSAVNAEKLLPRIDLHAGDESLRLGRDHGTIIYRRDIKVSQI